jgi:hypothetical protein
MKLFYFLFFITPLCLATFISPTTINGRFIVTNVDSLKLSVLIQVNTNSGTEDLGGATIVFSFDTSEINFTCNPVKDVDYIFHNFCGGSYSPATVTKPMKDKIWVNIDLPFVNSNNGTVVAGSPGWTDVVTIFLGVVDQNGTANLSWLTTNVFWGIYDADNASLWGTGVFKDLIDFTLPVELSSFTAKLVDGNVQLHWITKTEVNNFGFDIERKINEKEWVKIGFVEGHGNSNSPKSYTFIDKSATGGSKFKYRLKQIDTDGEYKYSESVELEIIPEKFAVYQNYPNPFNPSTTLKYSITDQSKVILKVYDILGKEIETLINEEKPTGTYELNWNAANLPSGVYFYQLKAGSFVETKKMILMK